MRRSTRIARINLWITCLLIYFAAATLAAEKGGAVGLGSPAPVSAPAFVQPYFFPSFGGFGPYGFFGGFYSPFIDPAPHYTTYPYLPKHWWAEPYPTEDPRQAGYNPNSGYALEEVTTLLLVTFPVKTRVILDGIFVGTSDNLGPIQLPLGLHTLRVEAAGFEPSHTAINIEEPTLQQLEVRLKPLPMRTSAVAPR